MGWAICPILISLTQNSSRISTSFYWPAVNTRILDPDVGSLSFSSPYQTTPAPTMSPPFPSFLF